MNSNWFDFDEDFESNFFGKSKVEYLKKNFGVNSKKIDKTGAWSTACELNDILDLATSKTDSHKKNKLLDALLNENFTGRNTIGHTSRFSEEPLRTLHRDGFVSDIDEKVNRVRSRFAGESYEAELERRSERSEKKESKFDSKINFQERTPSVMSSNSYGFTDVTNEVNRCRKDSVDSSWSRKSCQGNVTFPTSSASTISEACGGYSTKSLGRSISRDSDDSVCTEKSINSSAISEKLADGTDKTQVESNESWLRKSTSGSKISEKKINDKTMTEKNENGMCETSSTRMSYLEKSATGSSLQEEMTSEKVTSSSKGGSKRIEQKTSSETYKKSHSSTPSKSCYYDDLDSCTFKHFVPSSFSKICSENQDKTQAFQRKEFFRPTRTQIVSEKISKLIDEAVHQDDLFKIPSSLQNDIDKMTDDFFNSRAFGKDRLRTNRKRLTGLFSEARKDESFVSCSKLSELKSEIESLQHENLKLQSIIQDVTAVNKRWQKYNNERRLYVQKLLSTIQDLQEQINLISEKSAFQSKSHEEVGSQQEEIERLKKEHQEHITVLELQIKSHKDDWDAERREKRKALQEKEDLENKVHQLTGDVKFLKEVLQEEKKRKAKVCVSCNNNYDQNKTFSRMEFHPSPGIPSCPGASFCTSVHLPFNATDIPNEDYYCGKESISEGCDPSDQERNSYYTVSRNELNETFPNGNGRFPRSAKSKKSLTGDTVVVEDESGIRLSITEQFPLKDSNLKSILKKSDKKNKTIGLKSFLTQSDAKESKSIRNRLLPCRKPSITCEEFNSTDSNSFTVSIGFQKERPNEVTSFSPDTLTVNDSRNYFPTEMAQLLSVGVQDNRSKSEPNTRSNSSENLKPLRESYSWNSESFAADKISRDDVICPGCNRVFPSPSDLKFLDHYEI